MKIAAIIPCKNEELSITSVVLGLQQLNLPLQIIVVDNASTDNTLSVAKGLGVKVISEPKSGKGAAFRRGLMHLPEDCELVFMVDGDDTYSVEELIFAIPMIVNDGYQMIVGNRIPVQLDGRQQAFPRFHVLGNVLLSSLFSKLIGRSSFDTLSGWRLMTREFALSFINDKLSFTLELELNVHSMDLGAPVSSIPIKYSGRLAGSRSKLNKYRDGLRILRSSLWFFRTLKPERFFGFLSLPFLATGLALLALVIATFTSTGEMRLPSLIVGFFSMLISLALFMSGQIITHISAIRKMILRQKYQAK